MLYLFLRQPPSILTLRTFLIVLPWLLRTLFYLTNDLLVYLWRNTYRPTIRFILTHQYFSWSTQRFVINRLHPRSWLITSFLNQPDLIHWLELLPVILTFIRTFFQWRNNFTTDSWLPGYRVGHNSVVFTRTTEHKSWDCILESESTDGQRAKTRVQVGSAGNAASPELTFIAPVRNYASCRRGRVADQLMDTPRTVPSPLSGELQYV